MRRWGKGHNTILSGWGGTICFSGAEAHTHTHIHTHAHIHTHTRAPRLCPIRLHIFTGYPRCFLRAGATALQFQASCVSGCCRPGGGVDLLFVRRWVSSIWFSVFYIYTHTHTHSNTCHAFDPSSTSFPSSQTQDRLLQALIASHCERSRTYNWQ